VRFRIRLRAISRVRQVLLGRPCNPSARCRGRRFKINPTPRSRSQDSRRSNTANWRSRRLVRKDKLPDSRRRKPMKCLDRRRPGIPTRAVRSLVRCRVHPKQRERSTLATGCGRIRPSLPPNSRKPCAMIRSSGTCHVSNSSAWRTGLTSSTAYQPSSNSAF